MGSLVEIQSEFQFNTDKGSTHNYLVHYDILFSDYKDKEINLLEIGVLNGESLKLWSKYFVNAKLYGIDIFTRKEKGVDLDIDYVNKNLEGYNVQLNNVNSCGEKEEHIESRREYFSQFEDGYFDIIIDDGQHNSESQILTFNNFKKKLNKNGLYIIEDIKDWKDRNGRTHLENLKKVISDLEIIHHGRGDDILGLVRGENIK